LGNALLGNFKKLWIQVRTFSLARESMKGKLRGLVRSRWHVDFAEA